jgi:hypothetical protein
MITFVKKEGVSRRVASSLRLSAINLGNAKAFTSNFGPFGDRQILRDYLARIG